MYESESEMKNYLKFIFPENVSIERDVNNTIPKFFTFMSTNSDGVNSYFHNFIYYEQFTTDQMLAEFDKKDTISTEIENNLKKHELTFSA